MFYYDKKHNLMSETGSDDPNSKKKVQKPENNTMANFVTKMTSNLLIENNDWWFSPLLFQNILLRFTQMWTQEKLGFIVGWRK